MFLMITTDQVKETVTKINDMGMSGPLTEDDADYLSYPAALILLRELGVSVIETVSLEGATLAEFDEQDLKDKKGMN